MAIQSAAGAGEKKYGTGRQATVNQINKEMLNSPHNKNLAKSTIYNAIAWGDIGVSPLKTGRQGLIPPQLTHGLACYSVMMQVSGEGEALSLKMRAISSAITLGTQFENKFSTDSSPLLLSAKAIDYEDRRVDWLTYQNITDWNIAAKNFLISIGMGTEDQGLIRECFICFLFSIAGNSTNCLFVCFIADAVESKMGLVHEDNVDWFLTLDETHHEFSTVGTRGGAAAGHYINPSFPRSGKQCIVSTFHMTGVYGTTLRGEPLIPPLHPEYGISPRRRLHD